MEVFVMNREEILAKSRHENKNVMDERGQAIQTKANSISQGMGLILCLIVGFVGVLLSGYVCIIAACSAIYFGMFASERVYFALKHRGTIHWILAGFTVVFFVGMFVFFVISCVNGWSIKA